MYTVDKLICQLNKYKKDLTIEALLETKDVSSCFVSWRQTTDRVKSTSLLQGIYASLPTKSKTSAQQIFRATSSRKKRKIRSVALATVLEICSVSLPEDVRALFDFCKEDPSQFWKSSSAHVGIRWDSGKPFEVVASEAYLAVRRLNTQGLWDTILWRFYSSFFYNLASLLGNGQVNLTDGLRERLFETIAQSSNVTDGCGVIKENLRV